ncbi:hypothetical protein [Streptosporangium sp. 'caverna']|uniref:hypothetical protein n=1 Tax=Streptosporangium sp. 'caverna' TaxID=2202249 RepID=UPI0019551575|nr:hypothetical protein [Streptosporangium sp. 'caverna']
MAWVVDESRVMPFLTTSDRRDVVTRLLMQPMVSRVFDEESPGRQSPTSSPYKGKDFKDGKDSKENKDYKDGKDGKDNKDFKDFKDSKDGKDFKDGKDSKDRSDWAGVSAERKVFADEARPGARPIVGEALVSVPQDDASEILETLRASRATRLLRRRGLVI